MRFKLYPNEIGQWIVLRNSIYNMLGLGLPLIAALFSIPILIDKIGTEKFGILTLIWAIVSYFGVFDLGLGRAVTQQISLAYSEKKFERLNPIIGTSSALLLLLGIIGAFVLIASAPFVAERLSSTSSTQEVTRALLWMGVAMPAIVLTSGYRGILEGTSNFGLVNLIRLPMGLFTFIGPLVAVIAGLESLDSISAVLAIGRIVAALTHAWFALRSVSNLNAHGNFDKTYVPQILRFGGWLTLSNTIAPLIGYIDRFVIGFILGPKFVSFFVTPQEIASKISLVPMSITSAIFPTFATLKNEKKSTIIKSVNIYTIYICIICTVFVVPLFIFSHNIMSTWISESFADQSYYFLQLFCIGILINSFAHAPLSYLIFNGYAKQVSYIYLLETIPYAIGLISATYEYGLIGTAIIWLIRIIIDTLLLNYLFIKSVK